MDSYKLSLIQLMMAGGGVIFSSYVAGRLHQRYKQELDNDDAYRTGYDQASQFMLTMTSPGAPAAGPDAVP